MIKKILSIFLIIITIFSTSACSFNKETEEKQKKTIMTTSYINYTLTKQIVGNTADVILVQKKDKDLTAKELRDIRKSNIIIRSEKNNEIWLDNVLKKELKDIDVKIIDSSKGIELTELNLQNNLFINPEAVNNKEEDKNTIDSGEDINEKEDELFTSEEVNSKNSSEESIVQNTESKSDETIIDQSSYDSEIQEYLSSLNQYDVVEYLAPIRQKLYDTKNSTGVHQVKYAFKGKIYVFAYSANYDSFFLLEIQKINSYTDEKTKTDPYYWLKIENVELMAGNIKEGLDLLLDENTAVRSKNYKSLLDKLKELSESYSNELKEKNNLNIVSQNIPITLIQSYNLNYTSLYKGDEISLKDKSEYCDFLIRNKSSNYLIYFSNDEKTLAEEISTETQLEIVQLNLLDNVDNIEKTYYNYMIENLEILKQI